MDAARGAATGTATARARDFARGPRDDIQGRGHTRTSVDLCSRRPGALAPTAVPTTAGKSAIEVPSTAAYIEAPCDSD